MFFESWRRIKALDNTCTYTLSMAYYYPRTHEVVEQGIEPLTFWLISGQPTPPHSCPLQCSQSLQAFIGDLVRNHIKRCRTHKRRHFFWQSGYCVACVCIKWQVWKANRCILWIKFTMFRSTVTPTPRAMKPICTYACKWIEKRPPLVSSFTWGSSHSVCHRNKNLSPDFLKVTFSA